MALCVRSTKPTVLLCPVGFGLGFGPRATNPDLGLACGGARGQY